MKLERLTDGVSVIRARGGTGDDRRANTYVLEEGETLILVEPICHDHDEGRWWARQAESWQGREVIVTVTHNHWDHCDGMIAVVGLFNCPMFGSAGHTRAAPNFHSLCDELRGWRVISTPGHSVDHVCLFKDGVLVAGDMVSHETDFLPEGASNVRGAIVFDRPAYDASYEKLLALKPSLVLPGHGPHRTELPE